MRKFLQAISIIGVTLLAIYLVQVFNIFEYVSIVPVDDVEEIGLTAYVSILELIRGWVFDWAEKYILEGQSMVTCAFALKGDDVDINHNPSTELRDGNSIRSVDISIKVKGNKKRIAKGKVSVKFPDWVDIQNSNRETKARIQGRVWNIDLKDVVEHGDNVVDLDRKYGVSIIKNRSDDGLSDVIKFDYNKEPFNGVKYTSNTLVIKNTQ